MKATISVFAWLLMLSTAADAQLRESLDGPPNLTMRNGMRSCPPGAAVSGIHAANNLLLCSAMPVDSQHPLGPEFLSAGASAFPRPGNAADAATYSGPPMHWCGADGVVTGLNIANNTFSCRIFGSNQLLASPKITVMVVDQPPGQTARLAMHACPARHVLMGYHHINNAFLCGQLVAAAPPTSGSGPSLPPPVRTTILPADSVIETTSGSCSRVTVRVQGRPWLNVNRGGIMATLIGPPDADGSVRVNWYCAEAGAVSLESMRCKSPPAGVGPAMRLIIARPASGRSFSWTCVTP